MSKQTEKWRELARQANEEWRGVPERCSELQGELTAALIAAADTCDRLQEKVNSQSFADYAWQQNAAKFWQEKDRITEADNAKLQERIAALRSSLEQAIKEGHYRSPQLRRALADDLVRATANTGERK